MPNLFAEKGLKRDVSGGRMQMMPPWIADDCKISTAEEVGIVFFAPKHYICKTLTYNLCSDDFSC